MQHEKFHYSSMDEVSKKAEELGAFVPMTEDLSPLFRKLKTSAFTAENRIAFQPMEGSDGTLNGAPDALTKRRYLRFAEAGPGVIWFEAVATVPEGRASAHQLMLTEENADEFKRLLNDMRETSIRANGYAPVIIMQATNSGRYSKPNGYPEPMIAYNCPPLEDTPLPAERIVSDEDLTRFESAYEKTAKLCQAVGFDGMDVKCCHRYLACELLSAYTRPGKYGGSFENRKRFLKNCYRAAKSAINGTFFLTSRMNAFDGFAYPYGFGVKEGEGLKPDMTEAIRLIGELKEEFNIPLINITMGNPYKNPHVNRPYDVGNYVPDEHPLEGIGRIMKGTSEIQKAVDISVLGSAYSYLRQYSVNLAAAMVEGGHASMCGFGRMAFAYPDFIKEARENGKIEKSKACLTCGGCAVLLRAGTPAGCVIRDREVYHL